MRGWLVSIEITHDVTMGIIDVYYKLIYNVLKDYFLKIWIVNTYCIKNVSCHKTEKKTEGVDLPTTHLLDSECSLFVSLIQKKSVTATKTNVA